MFSLILCMSKIDSLIKVNLGLLSLGLAHFTFASAAQEQQMSSLTRIFFTKSTKLILCIVSAELEKQA